MRKGCSFSFCLIILLGILVGAYLFYNNASNDLNKTTVVEKESKIKPVENILPLNDGLQKNSNGVEFSCNDGTYHICGTPQASSYLNLYGGVDFVPEDLHEGELLNIQFQSGSAYVALGIRAFNEEYPDGTWLMKTSSDKIFVVPDLSKYTGVSIRILVTAYDWNVDINVTPVIQKAEKGKAYLTIIDDDGDMHYLTDIFPLTQELHVPISSAVTTTRVGSASHWLDWDDILYLNKNGCEILNHTYSHYTGTEIQEIDDATIYNNYKKSREELLRRGISGGDFLVYSSNTGNDERVQNIARTLFKCGIKIGGSTVNIVQTDPFTLSRYRIDYAATEKREDWNLADMRSYIDEVVSTGGWQIWMFHTSNSLWRQRVQLDENGEILYKDGNPLPMVDQDGTPILDYDGTYPTWGSTVLVPILKDAILYAQEMGVQIVSVEDGYNTIYK